MTRTLYALAGLSMLGLLALLQSNGEATLFADDCERRENGMIAAGGEGPGFGGAPRQSCFTERQMEYEPLDFPAVHIQKIEEYEISDREAMGVRVPYRSTNGWNRFWR